MSIAFDHQQELEARKAMVRRDLSNGFSRPEICTMRGISRDLVSRTIQMINKEDKEYLHKMKEDEIASDVLIMKERFLKIYRDARIMYAKIKDDSSVNLRDKTELLRFMGEISAAILKVDVEGVALVKRPISGGVPQKLIEVKNRVEEFNRTNDLDNAVEVLDTPLVNQEELDDEGKKLVEKTEIKANADDDPQKVF